MNSNVKNFSWLNKSIYSCESIINFDLGPDISKGKLKFAFYMKKTDTTSTVLDGGNEIILANWPDDKHINDIPDEMTFQIKFPVIHMY